MLEYSLAGATPDELVTARHKTGEMSVTALLDAVLSEPDEIDA